MSSSLWAPLGDAAPRFLQASDWRWNSARLVRNIYIHTTECHEVQGAARAVAGFFSRPRFDSQGRRMWGSSHIVADARELWACVAPTGEAYGAKGGTANAHGFHIELCGFAAQTPEQWADAYSQGELRLAARAAACVALHYGIPLVKCSPAELAAGAMGFAGHADVTAAWHVLGGHYDPGPAFPWGSFMAEVHAVYVTFAAGVVARGA